MKTNLRTRPAKRLVLLALALLAIAAPVAGAATSGSESLAKPYGKNAATWE